ncbi:MAG: DNA topoisomerase IB (poxvirus type) [uncultured Rubellimicrobium sp.]|uniref:DNA topoisomerase n=1 Tax=uncultured Rubellimicrobium sp. TaxID=543078 RepID=A0A6J4PU14_9RHOB|nr:MAG: DNA topoisomerase IB (poxvirus type) [uncultured Rubellimicrobium sp.]
MKDDILIEALEAELLDSPEVPAVEVPRGLVYVTDAMPGIRRMRRGKGFSYLAPDGTTIERGPERERLEKLGVPPAYENVWMCPLPHGHLQATGFDVRERKQYRYHALWSEHRSGNKFDRLVEFAHCLPAIRDRVARDLRAAPGEARFALAAAVTLIDRLSLRVGNEEYARENGSFGALTLRNKHVKLREGEIRLDFKAKSGQRVRRQLKDRRLLRILEKASDLPGAELLTWVDRMGQAHTLSSTQLNAYLDEADGDEELAFTAKTFRTWAGTLAAYERVEQGDRPKIKDLALAASERLHNTPAVAKSAYIHPRVLALAGEDAPALGAPEPIPGLSVPERRLLAFLESPVIG